MHLEGSIGVSPDGHIGDREEDGSPYRPELYIPTGIKGAIQVRKDPTVWMRAIRYHTYERRPIYPGDIYLAHEEMVETIENAKFAVREPGPPRAVRRPR